MLPKDIETIILEYHDAYDMIEKKKRINHIISCSYRNWLRDAGCYSRFYSIDEYSCKHEIYPFMTPRICITNHAYWTAFLNYFLHFESWNYTLNKLPCLPDCFSKL